MEEHQTISIYESENEEKQIEMKRKSPMLTDGASSESEKGGNASPGEGSNGEIRQASNASSSQGRRVLNSPMQEEHGQVQCPSGLAHFISHLNHRLEDRMRTNIMENLSDSVSIFKLPDALTRINRKSTEPEIVSIGPYHRGKDHLVGFEKHKLFFLQKFVRRSDTTLYNLLIMMESLEAETSMCYSENITMSKEDFIEMMMLDGCFLIVVLCHLGRDKEDMNIDDPIFTKPWLIPILVRDLLKLENQLPLSVLKFLFDKSKMSEKNFHCLALEFFNLSLPLAKNRSKRGCKHLLELVYFSLLPPFPENFGNERNKYQASTHSMQCATLLKLSRIKFKPRKDESLLNIKYDGGVLQIPPITLNEITSTLLINCVTLEQCQEYNIKYFSNYVSFMWCLMRQPEDVSFLSQVGIITNFSHDDRFVADFFKSLGENTAFSGASYLSKQIRGVESYYNSNYAYIMRTYFNSPWSFISVSSAFLLLLFTILQTILPILMNSWK